MKERLKKRGREKKRQEKEKRKKTKEMKKRKKKVKTKDSNGFQFTNIVQYFSLQNFSLQIFQFTVISVYKDLKIFVEPQTCQLQFL